MTWSKMLRTNWMTGGNTESTKDLVGLQRRRDETSPRACKNEEEGATPWQNEQIRLSASKASQQYYYWATKDLGII
jgi:hypothetical protein